MVKLMAVILGKYIFPFLGRKKRNGYLQSLEKPQSVFGSKSRTRSLWHAATQKITGRLPSRSRGRSYLSRSEKRMRCGRVIFRVSIVFLGVAAILGIVHRPVIHYVGKLDLFFIKRIDIKGYAVTDPLQIKKIIGLDYTTSMFAVDSGELERRLVDHDWIKSARIKKVWPHDLHIEVQEHKAAALLVSGAADYEKMAYINSKGEEIAPALPGDDLDFPVITIEKGFTGEKKDVLFDDAVYFLRLVADNDPNLPAQSVSEIHLSASEGIVIRLVDFPFPIYFGEGEVREKYKRLRKVLAVLYKKRKDNTDISEVSYIRMEYFNNKVLVAQSNSG
jgi:cell division protein FtsQ